MCQLHKVLRQARDSHFDAAAAKLKLHPIMIIGKVTPDSRNFVVVDLAFLVPTRAQASTPRLHQAAAEGQVEFVKALVTANSGTINATLEVCCSLFYCV